MVRLGLLSSGNFATLIRKDPLRMLTGSCPTNKSLAINMLKDESKLENSLGTEEDESNKRRLDEVTVLELIDETRKSRVLTKGRAD